MIKPLHTHVQDFDDCRRAFERINNILVSGGTLNEIQRVGVRVGDADIRILDFDKHFTLAESPDRDIDISLRRATSSLTGVGSYLPADFDVSGAGEISLNDTVPRMLAKATADSTVSNTSSETDFATTHTVDANSMVVGQVYRIRVSGILSTV